jgi:hypothetical protein
MTSSDSRSALPHFVGYSAYRVRRSQSIPRAGCPVGSHCWGGDGSLLFPRRLSHHSTPLTPQGSSGLHFQALHPFRGLRPLYPGSAPCWSLTGSPIDAAGFALCCGLAGCTFLREGSTEKARPQASTPRSLRTPVGCYEGVLAPPSTGLAPVSRCEPPGRTTIPRSWCGPWVTGMLITEIPTSWTGGGFQITVATANRRSSW